MLDIAVFAFFMVSLELIYFADVGRFVVIAPVFVFLLVLLQRLDKVELALSEEKRTVERRFQERRGVITFATLLGMSALCLLVYVLHREGVLPQPGP